MAQYIQPIYRERLIAELGVTAGQVKGMVRRGEMLRLGRGLYIDGAAYAGLTRDDQHIARVNAALAAQSTAAVVSHQSAAALWGLPLWRVPLDAIHLTKPPGAARRKLPGLHIHTHRLETSEVVVVDGMPTTTAARTVLDVALAVPFEPAVVVADAALCRGLVTPDEMAQQLVAAVGRHNRARAEAVFAFASPLSESPGESRSRVCFRLFDLPMPDLQHPVYRPNGSLVGRSDFWWREFRLLGEFDGFIKYQGDLLKPDQTPADVVYAEKRREDEMRALGYGVVRWGWTDLDDPAGLIRRIRRAMDSHRG